MFIFIFQTIWLFIDDLAGKGLDIVIIGKFLFYLMPNLTEKVLPLTVLLSSILTFGAFAENYEFAAMKASGISLQRSMLPLIILVSFLGFVTFYFANTVIPVSEQKIYNLRRNIATLKPAAVITEGVFSDFEGRNIKVERKYGENDRFLENVVIHEKSNLQKNTTVIKAATGELISGNGSPIIQLVLRDGHYYHEMTQASGGTEQLHPFARADFGTYIMNIELPDNMQDLEADRNVETDRMKNVSRLVTDIDSIREHNYRVAAAFSRSIRSRMGALEPLPSDTTDVTGEVSSMVRNVDSLIAGQTDSTAVRANPDTADTGVGTGEPDSLRDTIQDIDDAGEQTSVADTTPTDAGGIQQDSETIRVRDSIQAAIQDRVGKVIELPEEKKGNELYRQISDTDPMESFRTFEKSRLLDAARNSVRNILNSVKGKREELELSFKRYNRHILSLHNKYALALSCIILFFVGAPLGAIIRKGGLGLPMVIAIVLFLAYYFFGVFSNNYAKEGNIPPVLGAWLPTMIMLPLGVWLTRRATADRGLMSFGHFIDFLRERFSRGKKRDSSQ